MLRLLGSRKVGCDGVTRRDLLQLGGLGLFGVGLSDLFRLQELHANPRPAPHLGKAKACILIHLFGAHSSHETFDPKPAAPVEVQGEMKAIDTRVPGVQLGEGLPRVARIVDRLTVVRSLTHPFPFHHVHYALSGNPSVNPTVEADPNDRTLWPFLGSVLDYLEEKRTGPGHPAVPRNMALPFRLYSRANFRLLGGPYAGFLGSRYDPVWTDFSPRGTRPVPNPTNKSDLFDPYGGIRPEDRFDVNDALPADLSLQRIGLRRSLLEQFDHSRRHLESHERVAAFSRHQQRAYALLTSPQLARALDIQREPLALRERYGMTLFGQSLLAARRLVEADSRCVTVIWDAYGDATAGWDTHFHHYARLRKLLLPGFDAGFSALIEDLEARGLFDETLVLVLSEHGRTPKLSNNPGGGREHWSQAYSGVLAGAGAARGKVVGRTDSAGGQVRETPVSPKDVLATAFHLLGIDPHTTIPDRLNRPVPVAGEGSLRLELLT
jgi:hypothetical protein